MYVYICQVEAGRFELFPGYFKIATLIEEETAKQRHVAQSRRIDLKISIDDDDDDGDLRRVVIGDHVRLCQVFDNFLRYVHLIWLCLETCSVLPIASRLVSLQ